MAEQHKDSHFIFNRNFPYKVTPFFYVLTRKTFVIKKLIGICYLFEASFFNLKTRTQKKSYKF
ncbi:hypothetical protein B795N_17930 [Marinilactibacillus psychrotolerans]|nr:hypothetical protein B795N_17930 [Marinilactibacillus psychrotolerans]